MNLSKLFKYNKLWVALLGAVATVLLQFYGTNPKVQMLVSVLTALGVYQAKNQGA